MASGPAISSRLAALLQHRQIEAIVRTESAADEVQRAIEAIGQTALAVAMGQQGYQAPTRRAAVANTLRRMPQVATTKLEEMMVRLGLWSHGEAAKALADSIPRAWWFLSRPSPVFEADGPPAPITPRYVRVGDVLTGRIDLPRLFQSDAQAIDDFSEEEWRKIAEKVLFPPPSPEKVRQIVTAPNPQTGETWVDRLSGLSREIGDPDAVATQLVTGFSQGENVQELYKRLLPLTNGIQASARRVARTEGLRVAEQVQRESWDFLGDMMVGTQILAVLDQNTRPHHASRSGTVFYRTAKAGQKTLAELPSLPDEPNCRCWSSPVLTEPEGVDDPELQKTLTDNEKNSIPDPAAYVQWWRGADEGRRKLAVGVRRYEIAKKVIGEDRDLEWIDFIGEDGKLLPIDDLRNETPLQRAVRKARVREMLARREELVRQVSRQGFVTQDRTGDPLPEKPPVALPAPPSESPLIRWEPKGRVREVNRAIVDLGLAEQADFGAVSPEIADTWGQALSDYSNEFPELRGRLKFVGSMQARNRLADRKFVDKFDESILASWYGSSRDRTAGIAVNEAWSRDPSTLLKKLRDEIANGSAPKDCATLRYLLDHEFAHEIDSYLGLTLGDTLHPEIAALRARWTPGRVAVGLSEYAAEDVTELVAEGWGEWKNSAKPRQLATEVGQLIEGLFQRRRQQNP